jgi:hypothetical protein
MAHLPIRRRVLRRSKGLALRRLDLTRRVRNDLALVYAHDPVFALSSHAMSADTAATGPLYHDPHHGTPNSTVGLARAVSTTSGLFLHLSNLEIALNIFRDAEAKATLRDMRGVPAPSATTVADELLSALRFRHRWRSWHHLRQLELGTYIAELLLETSADAGGASIYTPRLPKGLTSGDGVVLGESTSTPAVETGPELAASVALMWHLSSSTIYGNRWFEEVAEPTADTSKRDILLLDIERRRRVASLVLTFALQPSLVWLRAMLGPLQQSIISGEVERPFPSYVTDRWLQDNDVLTSLPLHPLATGWLSEYAVAERSTAWGPRPTLTVPARWADDTGLTKQLASPDADRGRDFEAGRQPVLDYEAVYRPTSAFGRARAQLLDLFSKTEGWDEAYRAVAAQFFIGGSSGSVVATDMHTPPLIETDGLYASSSVGYPELPHHMLTRLDAYDREPRALLDELPQEDELLMGLVVPRDRSLGADAVALDEEDPRWWRVWTEGHPPLDLWDPSAVSPTPPFPDPPFGGGASWRDASWRGDVDATAMPLSLDAFARRLGLPETQLVTLIRANLLAWAHLFTVDAATGKLLPVVAGSFAFRSDRTTTCVENDSVRLRSLTVTRYAIVHGKRVTGLASTTASRFVHRIVSRGVASIGQVEGVSASLFDRFSEFVRTVLSATPSIPVDPRPARGEPPAEPTPEIKV